MSKVLESENRSDDCCGGPAPEGIDACCKLDADAKAEAKTGCGCGQAQDEPKATSAKHDGCC